jgi:cell division protein FtsW
VDYGLIAIIALMLALSLALVLGASYATEGTYFFTRQLLWIGLGVVAGLIMTRIPYRVWRPLSVPIMLLALILLVAVLFLGKEINGARRTFGGSIQPSEAAKLAVIMYVSAWVEARGRHLDQARQGLLPFLIIMGLVTFLLVLEPSFSVAIIVLVIGVSIFFVGGGNILQMLLLAALAAPALLLVFFRSGHAGRRIVQWLLALRSPGAIPSDTSPVWQKITILPEGLADRIASPANVPLPWSDYLFAYTAGRLGFLGALLIVILYAALAYRLLSVALNAPDRFGLFMAVGVTAWIVTQAVIHIGANSNLLPETGQPLPFMSYGGSSMLAVMVALGLSQSIARASPARKPLYASLTLGGWHRRPRLPAADRGERSKTTHQRGHSTGAAAHTPTNKRSAGTGHSGATRGVSRTSAAYGKEVKPIKSDELDGKPAWRNGRATRPRRKPAAKPTGRPTSRR